MGKDTLEKCYSTLMQVARNCSHCIAILMTKDIISVPFLARFGLGFHRCLHISGCLATRWTDAETSSRHPLLLLRMGSKPTTILDIGATQSLLATFCQRRTFLVHCLPVTFRRRQYICTRLGAVAFTVLRCVLIHPYADYPTHCWALSSAVPCWRRLPFELETIWCTSWTPIDQGQGESLHLSSTWFETRRITTRANLAIQVHTCATCRDIQSVSKTGLDHVAMRYQQKQVKGSVSRKLQQLSWVLMELKIEWNGCARPGQNTIVSASRWS